MGCMWSKEMDVVSRNREVTVNLQQYIVLLDADHAVFTLHPTSLMASLIGGQKLSKIGLTKFSLSADDSRGGSTSQ